MKKHIIFVSIIILEYILVLQHFKNPRNNYSKIGLLFCIYITINSFNSYYNTVNNTFILLIILYFHNRYKILYNNLEEQFTNKLQQLKDINKLKSEESSLNKKDKNDNSKSSKKEKFKNTENNLSLKDYRDSFNQYKFTRKVKGSIDALNKIPYFIEKFNDIWN